MPNVYGEFLPVYRIHISNGKASRMEHIPTAIGAGVLIIAFIRYGKRRMSHARVSAKLENVQTESEFHGTFATVLRNIEIHYWSRVKTLKDNAANECFNPTLYEEFTRLGNTIAATVVFNRRLTRWLVEYSFGRRQQELDYSNRSISFIYVRACSENSFLVLRFEKPAIRDSIRVGRLRCSTGWRDQTKSATARTTGGDS
jgi:hypothetical protein